MRGTKHDASQHQRRGIRSRLIASVAAVAMLATSIAAGTAVAADIDETDPTQQNTIVEQPQQGTENAGDQTGEQNTEPEGDQTDQPQESGDTATETESDNTAEADSTEEADPKADADKADDDQPVEKQSATVPAPQAANAAADGGVSVQAEGEGSELFTETFTGAALGDGWVLPEGNNSACLTAATSGKYECKNTISTSKYMQSTAADGVNRGEGYLQLTDNSTGKNGIVLYDRPVYANAGLDIEFDQWQFGGIDHADGIGFFLTQGSGKIEQGPHGDGVGGALGYGMAYDHNNKTWVEGIKYGLLGVGLDAWGNFSGSHQVGSDSKPSGVDDQPQNTNSVAVRGAGAQDDAGRWLEGYELIAKNRLYNDGLNVVTSEPSQNGYSDRWKTNDSGQANGVHVHIKLDSEQDSKQWLTVTLTEAGKQTERQVIHEQIDAIRGTVRFGFSASTGSYTDAHFIRNMRINSVNPVGDITLAKEPDVDHEDYQHVYQEGDSVPYQFTITNTGGHALSNVTLQDDFLQDGTLSCAAGDGSKVDFVSSLLQPGGQWVCTGSTVLKSDYPTATEESPKGWSQDRTTFTNIATVTGTYTDGEGTKTVTADATATVNTIPSLPAPTHEKRLKQCSDDSCEFELSLDVTGAAEGGSTSTPADVVIVLDKSGSMSDKMGNGSRGTRWETAKSAIATLLDGLLGDDKDNRVSLVTFSGGMDDDCIQWGMFGCWVYGDNPYDDAQIASDWTKSKTEITNAYGSPDGGTNWEAGLRTASELLDTARDDASKYVVFVSDGNAGYYYDNNGETQGTGNPGTGFDQTAYDKAETQAKLLDAMVFSIGVGPQDNVNKMVDFATDVDGEYFSGASESDLNDAVEAIVQAIRTQSSYTDVTITDTLSGYMDFAFSTDQVARNVSVTAAYADGFDHEGLPEPVAPSGDNLKVEVKGKKITVSFPDFDLQNGVVYTVTFRVAPTQKAYDEAEWTDAHVSQEYPSNDPVDGATLSYRNKVTSSASGDSSGDMKTVAYDEKPMFTVPASTITVNKKWTSEPHPEKATIQLYRDGASYLEPVSVGDDGYTFYVPAGPDGHTYSVMETGNEGWVPSYSYTAESPSTVTENGDGVMLKGLCAQTATAKVTNTPKTYTYDVDAHLNLRKNLTNGSLSKGDFKFILTVEHPTDKDGIALYDMEDNKIEAGEDGPLTETVANGTDSDASVVQFGKIEFSEQGMYMVSVREPEEGREDGIRYDDRTLYVLYVLDGSMNMKRYIHRAAADEKAPAVPENPDSIDDQTWTLADGVDSIDPDLLTWNNTITVSSLPLTGGRSTARTLLLAGGGVLLVAGAAWLLARRRQV